MYTTTLASAYAFQLPSITRSRRTLIATVLFALGALVGWPFASAIAIPFVFEEIFLLGADRVEPKDRSQWAMKRFLRLVQCGLAASLILVHLFRFFWTAINVYLAPLPPGRQLYVRQVDYCSVENCSIQYLRRFRAWTGSLWNFALALLFPESDRELQCYRCSGFDVTPSAFRYVLLRSAQTRSQNSTK